MLAHLRARQEQIIPTFAETEFCVQTYNSVQQVLWEKKADPSSVFLQIMWIIVFVGTIVHFQLIAIIASYIYI